jgi:uncharacterized protein (AIM24 family)
MKVTTPGHIGHIRIQLDALDILNVLHPKSMIAYQGLPQNREDRFMDLAAAYRKRKWIRSRMQGPSEMVIALPAGCSVETLEIPVDSNLLFDFRHVMFFTEGMGLKSRIQKIKNAWITREWVRMKFTGPGSLGIITQGELATIQLQTDQPLFVESGSLVAYPENANIKLSVYGNTLASQHMSVQWEITGSGPVLIQTGSNDTQLIEQLHHDSFIKRLLRELLPFGGIYIK